MGRNSGGGGRGSGRQSSLTAAWGKSYISGTSFKARDRYGQTFTVKAYTERGTGERLYQLSKGGKKVTYREWQVKDSELKPVKD